MEGRCSCIWWNEDDGKKGQLQNNLHSTFRSVYSNKGHTEILICWQLKREKGHTDRKGATEPVLQAPSDWSCMSFFVTRWNVIFFRYRTWYTVAAGRKGSVCAFTEKYINHGDSSRICYLLRVFICH